ncbi:CASP C terminal-domain-containing protein [Obelidium mucronatum]|nr:CASP C terminal-domain-containing protein [Obelidium mucronatum]
MDHVDLPTADTAIPSVALSVPDANINLSLLQKQLDVQGLEIVENQKESNKNKKKLSDLTKEFKKIPDEEKLKEFKVLLKAYQQEIDSITKRSKTAESSFLSLYKHLAEAPDPAPLIASLSNHPQLEQELAIANEELKALKATMSTMERDVATGKASEGQTQTLKARLATYEAKLDDMVSEKVLAKEIEIKQATDEKIRIYKETEYALQRQLNLMKDQLSNLQSSHDVTQAKLVDYSSQYDQEVAGKLGELEIVTADLERANQKAASASRENEILKNELATLRGDSTAMAASMHQQHRHDDPAVLQRKVKAQDAEISKLLDELNKYKVKLHERDAFATRRLTEMERELAVKKLETEQLNEKLLQFDDYERIKRELDVMKSIEFGSVTPQQNDGLWDEPGSAGSEQSLEKMLMEKNKRLQGEVTALKVTKINRFLLKMLLISIYRNLLDSQASELNHINQDLEHTKLQCGTQQQLIAKLEEDVYNLNSIVAGNPNNRKPTAHPVENAVDVDPLMSINVRSNLSNQPELVPVLGNSIHPVGVSTNSSSESMGGSSNSSIVPILASQRDRYRQRNSELEEQAKATAATIADLKFNMDNLKNDNIKLYEKLRYAESFQNSHNNGSHAVNISRTSPSPRNGDDISNRYNSLYEGSLDPFHRFHRNEQASRVNKLNPAEKAALMFTRILVGNKYTRIGFVIYSVVLHCLVFATLYLLSQWEECRHDHVVPVPPLNNIH